MADEMMPVSVETSQLTQPILAKRVFKRPNHKRRRELNDAYKANISWSDAPYAGVTIESIEELLWILHERQWSGGFPEIKETWPSRLLKIFTCTLSPYVRSNTPADLRFTILYDLRDSNQSHGIDLQNINLDGAKLIGADLHEAQLQSASLIGADLKGTLLSKANLTNTALLPEEQEQRWKTLFPPLSSPPASFAGVSVKTRNELLWLLRNYDWLNPEKRTQVNLYGLDMRGADVFDQDVEEFNLDGVILIDEDQSSVTEKTRIQQLKTAVVVNQTAERPPFAGVTIASRQELLWIKRWRGWSGIELSGNRERADFRNAIFASKERGGGDFAGTCLYGGNLRYLIATNVDLSGAQLNNANLLRVDLTETLLTHSDLSGARLFGATMNNVTAIGANFFRAAMQRVSIVGASLRGSDLSLADLRGTDCRDSDARGADLRGASIDAKTSFINFRLNSYSLLGDIIIYSMPLLQVTWRDMKRLGDEMIIDRCRSKNEREKEIGNVIRAYRQLAITLKRQAFYIDATRFRRRQRRFERLQARENKEWRRWISLWVFNLLGHAESIPKIILAYLLIIPFYGGIYYALATYTTFFIPQAGHYNMTFWQAVALSSMNLPSPLNFPKALLQQPIIGHIFPFLGVTESALFWLLALCFTVLFTQRIQGES